jgi:hypothetical protein
MLGWGIGVISHGIKTFGIGTDWEERQIKKYMEKEEENAKKWKENSLYLLSDDSDFSNYDGIDINWYMK